MADVRAGSEATVFPDTSEADGARRRRKLPLGLFGDALESVAAEYWVLGGMVVIWVAVFGRLAYLRQVRFGSYAFDMGIFDQATWLISHHHGLFITVRGLHFFGHHANMGLFLLAPFYWLGAGANFLNFVMVLSMALGAVPIFLLARDRLVNSWLALALAGAYLLHPALQFMAWELFHPEVMAITPLFFAWWLARRQRWGWFAVSVVYAACWKEDVAVAVAVIGLVLIIRRHWRPGLLTGGLALGWFAFVNNWMLATFSGSGHAFYTSFFGTLGNSTPQVIFNAIRHPSRVTKQVFAADAVKYYWQMAAPFAFVALAAPAALAVGLPQVLFNVLSINNFTRTITYHYAALPLVGLTLGTVEGVAHLGGRPSVQRFLTGLVAATALAGTVALGPSPLGAKYRSGLWPLRPDSRGAAKEAAVRVPPTDAHVSASYNLTPHIDHRRFIYDFPNPWISDNWAVHGENLPDPNIVRWLVLDKSILSPANVTLLDRLLTRREFRVVYDRDNVIVARRVHQGTRAVAAGIS